MEDMLNNLKALGYSSTSQKSDNPCTTIEDFDKWESEHEKQLVHNALVEQSKTTSLLPQTNTESENELIAYSIKDKARDFLFWKRSRNLIDDEDLRNLYFALDAAATGLNGDKFIFYEDYKQAVASLGKKFENFLSAKTFVKLLDGDILGRVYINHIVRYVMRKTWLVHTRIGLSAYDHSFQGCISKSGLACYLDELIPTLTQLKNMEPSQMQFYKSTVIRKIFFLLDPNRSDRIRILDVLLSQFIDDLLDLKEEVPCGESNLFSKEAILKHFDHYLRLDTDQNGLLSRKEFMRFGNGAYCLSETFVNRLFDVYKTFDGEMDYNGYLDFVLAIENSSEPQSIRYFFKILDVNNKGYLDSFSLHCFYKEIAKYQEQQGAEKVDFQDLKDEIFDMIKPSDPLKISLKDLIKCGKADDVITIFIDLNGLAIYESRQGQK